MTTLSSVNKGVIYISGSPMVIVRNCPDRVTYIVKYDGQYDMYVKIMLIPPLYKRTYLK